MTLIVLTVAVIALLVAVLAIFLFALGFLLNRIADNLDDCSHSVRTISRHASVIGPGVKRLNHTGGELVGAMPLLYDGAELLVAQSVAQSAVPVAAASGVGYMDM